MSDLAAHASRARAQSKALKKAKGGGGEIYVRCGVARLPICPGDTRSGKCARLVRADSWSLQSVHPVRRGRRRPPPPRAVFWNWNTSNSFRTVPYYTLERIRDEPRRRWRSAGRVNTAARAEQGGSNVFSCERHIEDEEHFALLPRLLLMRNSRRSFERAPIIYHRQSLASRAWRRQWPTRSRRSV